MLHQVGCEVTELGSWGGRVWSRYRLLQRVASTANRCGVRVLAFGLAPDELRLVLEGTPAWTTELMRSVKVGTTASYGHLELGSWTASSVEALEQAAAWAHLGPAGGACPLSSPWSSHRDLLGYRTAAFYDPAVLASRVDVRRLHERAGGGHLPRGWPPTTPRREPLELLLRVAAGVLGVVPSDRRAFRLFVHLGGARGWRSSRMAKALALTPRRIRQLACLDEPRLPLALTTLGDRRLRVVP